MGWANVTQLLSGKIKLTAQVLTTMLWGPSLGQAQLGTEDADRPLRHDSCPKAAYAYTVQCEGHMQLLST